MLDSLTATGGEQDKQTHRNRGCSVTETWTNKRFPGRLMISSTRKNDSCSWGVLPPNIIPQLCMYIQHGVSSTGQQLKTRKTKLLFLGCTSPNNHIVIFIQQNGQQFTTHFAITNNMQLKHFHFPNRGRLFKSITNLLDLRCVMLYTILRL